MNQLKQMCHPINIINAQYTIIMFSVRESMKLIRDEIRRHETKTEFKSGLFFALQVYKQGILCVKRYLKFFS